ncbi:MAG: 1-deoxy-D-xylulose-5-phosphate reductoisomerase [Deltaproteobacteria bacterium]|nr:1-deoxy-D-xylulose-5-phosphate reductoisomerase [Deltaproteobacteria bacterium]
MKKLAILGSTGSIGTQALDLVSRHPDRFEVLGLVAGRNLDLLEEQIKKFHPRVVSVSDEKDASALQKRVGASALGGSPVPEIVWGQNGACQVAAMEGVDLVLSAIVGAAGLLPTYEALKKGRSVALANKESLVIAGELMTSVARQKKVSLFPVDSEHSAIFQCLVGNNRADLKRIILTASGGPFFKKTAEELKKVTLEEALKHPNWNMGAKITVDSATLMNKGLEVIEASWLFDLTPDRIDVQIHPQSIVHSMVEYKDGSVMAQMGVPDMRCAIGYALSYPDRIETGVKSLDLLEIGNLSFHKPDPTRFRCLDLAFQVARTGGSMPAVLNAANEVVVEKFLNKEISFLEIAEQIEKTLLKHTVSPLKSLDDVLEADQWARRVATTL